MGLREKLADDQYQRERKADNLEKIKSGVLKRSLGWEETPREDLGVTATEVNLLGKGPLLTDPE